MNSGINPNLSKSSERASVIDFLIFPTTLESELKPILLPTFLLLIISSIPVKAPPQINNILEVSTCKNSC